MPPSPEIRLDLANTMDFMASKAATFARLSNTVRSLQLEDCLPQYSLLDVRTQKSYAISAANREHAVAQFGAQLGLELTLDDTGVISGVIPNHMMDEWEGSSVHSINYHIPVYVK